MKCPHCNGQGVVIVVIKPTDGIPNPPFRYETCSICNGSGSVEDNKG